MSSGVILSLLASCCFGGLYYFVPLLAPLDGEAVFAWRMLFTLPLLTLFMLASGDLPRIGEVARRVRREPWLFVLLPLSAALIGLQLWLFLSAPLYGWALPVSLGYFLLPLTMVLAGRVVYRDVLSPAQRLAVICAAVGVAAAIFNAGGLHWTALAVAFGYPPYFMLRRRLDLAHLGALWWDILLLWPLALWFLLRTGDSPLAPFASHPHLWLWVTLMGVFATLGLLFYILASRLLMFSLFGLLSYVEPVLLVLVAILLGERLAPHDWFTYVPIWLAVLALLVDGIRRLRNEAMRRNANMVQSPP